MVRTVLGWVTSWEVLVRQAADVTPLDLVGHVGCKSVMPDLNGCVVPEKSNTIIGVVTAGFECLPPSCDGLTDPEDH
ncbi:hypothetical protein F511_02687 [Dorcoceras hygrometricum]|uniref:Uncharacterized protein n=1 Tax=Dorcoceras hygrometricum TaxID=472368 RepID=A0A2Z7A202_9LAMI|nr:hypothetical protein F511_02687 [Dorcoceras hygrometricum]